MPAKSKKQLRFMEAVAHGMKPRNSNISRETAQEFVDATPKGAFGNALRKRRKKKEK